MKTIDLIVDLLRQKLSAESVEIEDQSHLHKGMRALQTAEVITKLQLSPVALRDSIRLPAIA